MRNNMLDLGQHYRNVSDYLLSQYRLSSSYGHRGSKGNIREDFLTRTLKEMAHDHVRLVKGEVCDSNGSRSPEFDIIISYMSNVVRLFSSEITRVLPVESVLSVLEVKSILSKDSIIKFNSDMKSLNSFQRFYTPSPTYKALCEMRGTTEYTNIEGHAISPKSRAQGIGSIIGGIIAFDAPKVDIIIDLRLLLFHLVFDVFRGSDKTEKPGVGAA